MELRFTTAKGKPLWTHIICQPKIVNDKTVKLYGSFQDITQRKHAEYKILESEKRLNEAQRIAKMGDFTWGVETGEITWSDAMYDLIQYDRTEVIDFAKVDAEIHHLDDLDRVTQWLYECLSSTSDTLIPNEYRILRKDGTVLHVRTMGKIFRKKGRAVKVFATIQDITERVKLMQKIEKSQDQLHSLAERLITIREDEQTRIARELHDQLGHALTGLKMDLNWLNKKLPDACEKDCFPLFQGPAPRHGKSNR